MRVRHPYSLTDDGPTPDGAVHWGGRRQISDVDEDGTFHVPDGASHNLDRWAAGYGYDLSELIVTDGESGDSGEGSAETTDGSASDETPETCTATLTSGGTCGRDLPCPYHSED